jgi:hypothetical protein
MTLANRVHLQRHAIRTFPLALTILSLPVVPAVAAGSQTAVMVVVVALAATAATYRARTQAAVRLLRQRLRQR